MPTGKVAIQDKILTRTRLASEGGLGARRLGRKDRTLPRCLTDAASALAMELFTKLFGDLLAFVYHCFDRIVIHGYVTRLCRKRSFVRTVSLPG
jgi:hypothetical protein